MTPSKCLLLLLISAAILTCGCVAETASPAASQLLRLATTTSTRDSGLLDQLLPEFEENHRCRVDVIAVGTGAALALGEAGDVDVLMVHARDAELEFMEAELGIRHEEFMYNEFVLLGPQADPAQIKGLEPAAAMQRIAAAQERFVSRGDGSGTHMREQQLWEVSGPRPMWDQYIEVGQGMGPTLIMANEMQAYVLADTGTYLNFQGKVELVPLAASSDLLRNPYAAIVVNPRKHEDMDNRLVNAFVDFLISAPTQQRIADYRIAGQPLFYPTRHVGNP